MKLSVQMLGALESNSLAKQLYQTAFPKEEQLSWWLLRLLTIQKDVNFNCYYEGDQLCGFTYTVQDGKILFVMFLAVRADLRSKGYGSAILSKLKQDHPECQIVLNVEPIIDTAENLQERIARMHFYEKNGFFDTGYNIDEVGGTFRVLSTCQTVDADAYLRVFQKMSFGLWKPKMTKIDDVKQ